MWYQAPDGTRQEFNLQWTGTPCRNQVRMVHLQFGSETTSTDSDMSKAIQKYMPLYKEVRRLFLLMCIKVEATCPITGRSIDMESDIHHKKGRSATSFADEWAKEREIPLLIDVRHFLAVTREGHDWIELHPAKARELGYSEERLNTLR